MKKYHQSHLPLRWIPVLISSWRWSIPSCWLPAAWDFKALEMLSIVNWWLDTNWFLNFYGNVADINTWYKLALQCIGGWMLMLMHNIIAAGALQFIFHRETFGKNPGFEWIVINWKYFFSLILHQNNFYRLNLIFWIVMGWHLSMVHGSRYNNNWSCMPRFMLICNFLNENINSH